MEAAGFKTDPNAPSALEQIKAAKEKAEAEEKKEKEGKDGIEIVEEKKKEEKPKKPRKPRTKKPPPTNLITPTESPIVARARLLLSQGRLGKITPGTPPRTEVSSTITSPVQPVSDSPTMSPQAKAQAHISAGTSPRRIVPEQVHTITPSATRSLFSDNSDGSPSRSSGTSPRRVTTTLLSAAESCTSDKPSKPAKTIKPHNNLTIREVPTSSQSDTKSAEPAQPTEQEVNDPRPLHKSDSCVILEEEGTVLTDPPTLHKSDSCVILEEEDPTVSSSMAVVPYSQSQSSGGDASVSTSTSQAPAPILRPPDQDIVEQKNVSWADEMGYEEEMYQDPQMDAQMYEDPGGYSEEQYGEGMYGQTGYEDSMYSEDPQYQGQYGEEYEDPMYQDPQYDPQYGEDPQYMGTQYQEDPTSYEGEVYEQPPPESYEGHGQHEQYQEYEETRMDPGGYTLSRKVVTVQETQVQGSARVVRKMVTKSSSGHSPVRSQSQGHQSSTQSSYQQASPYKKASDQPQSTSQRQDTQGQPSFIPKPRPGFRIVKKRRKVPVGPSGQSTSSAQPLAIKPAPQISQQHDSPQRPSTSGAATSAPPRSDSPLSPEMTQQLHSMLKDILKKQAAEMSATTTQPAQPTPSAVSSPTPVNKPQKPLSSTSKPKQSEPLLASQKAPIIQSSNPNLSKKAPPSGAKKTYVLKKSDLGRRKASYMTEKPKPSKPLPAITPAMRLKLLKQSEQASKAEAESTSQGNTLPECTPDVTPESTSGESGMYGDSAISSSDQPPELGEPDCALIVLSDSE